MFKGEIIPRELKIEANYIFSNGDKTPVTILGYDGKGRCWVKWHKDDFVNMVDEWRLEIIKTREVVDDLTVAGDER